MEYIVVVALHNRVPTTINFVGLQATDFPAEEQKEIVSKSGTFFKNDATLIFAGGSQKSTNNSQNGVGLIEKGGSTQGFTSLKNALDEGVKLKQQALEKDPTAKVQLIVLMDFNYSCTGTDLCVSNAVVKKYRDDIGYCFLVGSGGLAVSPENMKQYEKNVHDVFGTDCSLDFTAEAANNPKNSTPRMKAIESGNQTSEKTIVYDFMQCKRQADKPTPIQTTSKSKLKPQDPLTSSPSTPLVESSSALSRSTSFQPTLFSTPEAKTSQSLEATTEQQPTASPTSPKKPKLL